MRITNKTSSQLIKGQKITDTYTYFTSNKGVVSEIEEVDILEIIQIRKSKKSESGLRVKVRIVQGASEGSGFVIVDFDNQKNKFGTLGETK